MLAKELAMILMETPEAEVLVKHTSFGKWGEPLEEYFTTDDCDSYIDIPKVYAEYLTERPDDAVVINLFYSLGTL